MEENPNVSKIQILIEMMSQRYINTFKPNTVTVKKCVKSHVSKLLKEEVENILKTNIDRVQEKAKITKNEILKTMKDADFIVKGFGEKAVGEVGKIIKKYVDDFVNKEMEKKKPIKVKVESHAERAERQEDPLFYKIKEFTNNFDFLAESIDTYYSNGYKHKIKFDNFEEFSKFGRLQVLLQNCMSSGKVTEEVAIKSLLKNEKIELSKLDKKVLNARSKVIKAKNINQVYDMER